MNDTESPDDATIDLDKDGKADVSARFLITAALVAFGLVLVAVLVLLLTGTASWDQLETAAASLVSLIVGAGGGAAARR